MVIQDFKFIIVTCLVFVLHIILNFITNHIAIIECQRKKPFVINYLLHQWR